MRSPRRHRCANYRGEVGKLTYTTHCHYPLGPDDPYLCWGPRTPHQQSRSATPPKKKNSTLCVSKWRGGGGVRGEYGVLAFGEWATRTALSPYIEHYTNIWYHTKESLGTEKAGGLSFSRFLFTVIHIFTLFPFFFICWIFIIPIFLLVFFYILH